ncbi:hypothetical protein ACGFXC_35780 [Streptomyces sp. NPDC048507]|uniref:hypothetical protein n=1 Tax=Streptomyces sp. NPDC048507 TaxID=3365560 RepID=UPI0037189132
MLQRASGERPEAADALAAFLDTHSPELLHRYLRASGLDDAAAPRPGRRDRRVRARHIDRRRVLRSELGDRAVLQDWLSATIQRLADG